MSYIDDQQKIQASRVSDARKFIMSGMDGHITLKRQGDLRALLVAHDRAVLLGCEYLTILKKLDQEMDEFRRNKSC